MSEEYVGILDLTIIVVGTTGHAVFDCDGRIEIVSVIHEGATAYSYVIRDNDGFGVVARTGLRNNVAISEDKLTFGRNIFSLINVTDPGEYSIRLRGGIRGKQIS